MFKYQFSTKFILDVSLVLEYIASILSNPAASKRLRNEINTNIQSIKVFPEGFPIFDTEGKTQYIYRKVKVKNYYILYYIDSNNNIVVFSRFVYSKMNLNELEL